MSGLKCKDLNEMIKLELLAVTRNLQRPVEGLNSCMNKLTEGKDGNESAWLHELQNLLTVFKSRADELERWTELQLLGESVNSADLVSFTDEVLKRLQDHHPNIVFVNCVGNSHLKINIALYEFVLRRVLCFITNFCRGIEQLNIESSVRDAEVIISISNIKKGTFQLIEQQCLNTSGHAFAESDAALFSCYEVLAFYGGNIWSESSATTGSKLCFSIFGEKGR
jgi:hypothetical protein